MASRCARGSPSPTPSRSSAALIVFAGAAVRRAQRAARSRSSARAALDAGRPCARASCARRRAQGTPLTVEREAGDGPARHGTRVYATEELRSLLERVPGYFIVLRPRRPADLQLGRHPSAPATRTASAIDAGRGAARARTAQGISVAVSDSLFGGRLLLAARRDPALLAQHHPRRRRRARRPIAELSPTPARRHAARRLSRSSSSSRSASPT